jgi:hypothetical protein
VKILAAPNQPAASAEVMSDRNGLAVILKTLANAREYVKIVVKRDPKTSTAASALPRQKGLDGWKVAPILELHGQQEGKPAAFLEDTKGSYRVEACQSLHRQQLNNGEFETAYVGFRADGTLVTMGDIAHSNDDPEGSRDPLGPYNRALDFVFRHLDMRYAYILMEQDGLTVSDYNVVIRWFDQQGSGDEAAGVVEQLFARVMGPIAQLVVVDADGEQEGQTVEERSKVGFVYIVYVCVVLAKYLKRARAARLAVARSGPVAEAEHARKMEAWGDAQAARADAAEADAAQKAMQLQAMHAQLAAAQSQLAVAHSAASAATGEPTHSAAASAAAGEPAHSAAASAAAGKPTASVAEIIASTTAAIQKKWKEQKARPGLSQMML